VVHVYPWDKVVRMYLGSTRHSFNLIGAYTYTDYSSTLILSDGAKLSLTGMFQDPALSPRKRPQDSDEHGIFMLMSAASKVISQKQLPGAMAGLERGEQLTFGDITFSLAGVHAAKGLIRGVASGPSRCTRGSSRPASSSQGPASRWPRSRTPSSF
jgi:hypothetical protein